jgi:predicted RecA/RadA family phage recombinase
MKNYVQEGDTLTLIAPYALTPGQGLQVGAIFGVASSTAASGAEVEAALTGVFEITALNTDTGSVGALMYWDNTNRRLTTTASTHVKVGVLTVAKTNGQTTATVRLSAAF